MSRKAGALFVLWFLATVGAVSLGRFAMGIVADEVASTSVAPLSQAAVTDALEAADETSSTTEGGTAAPPTSAGPASTTPTTKPSATPGSTTTTTPSSSTSSSSTTTTTTGAATNTTETRSGVGGSVTVRFSCGSTAELVSASPNPGYTTDIEHSGPQEVDVKFEKTDGEGETRIRAKCENGRPDWRVEEDDD
ncbi:MAG: hypothetical protein HYU28_05870 [Actinobacteria bacterium]|nr:hypothetical protein [Actinomycetota bacterium]